MAHIIICSLGFRGHVNPLLGIAQALVSRGHDVTWYCTEPVGRDIAETGATFQAYASTFDPKFEFPTNNVTSSYFFRSVAEARYVLPQLLASLRHQTPDLVIYDGAFLAGRLLCERLQVPAVKLCPSYASTETYNPFADSRKAFFQNTELLSAFDAEVAKLNAECGVNYDLKSSVGHAEAFNIVCMPKAFHPDIAAFDERFLFIGPSLRHEQEQDLKRTNTGRPLLYISLGTLNNNKPGFYESCFEAFADSEWDVLMAVGNRVDRSAWRLPTNIRVEPFIPQLQVLRQASVFISQGGMNSVQEALYFGVPVIAVPSTGEQALTAQRINELQLGIGMEGEQPSSAGLKKAVNDLLERPEIYQQVRQFAHTSKNAGGCVRAVEEIEKMIAV